MFLLVTDRKGKHAFVIGSAVWSFAKLSDYKFAAVIRDLSIGLKAFASDGPCMNRLVKSSGLHGKLTLLCLPSFRTLSGGLLHFRQAQRAQISVGAPISSISSLETRPTRIAPAPGSLDMEVCVDAVIQDN